MEITRISIWSGIERTKSFDISEKQWEDYCNGTHIQSAMSNLTAEEREFIISGSTQEEWDKYMKEPDEEEVEEEVILLTKEDKATLKLWRKAIPARKDVPFCCPNCGTHSNLENTEPTSFLDKDETEFSYEPEPHYSWDELHKCLHCGTIYIIKNGT